MGEKKRRGRFTKEDFDRGLKEEFEQCKKIKGTGYHNYPFDIKYSLACCVIWGYSLSEIMRMRLSMEDKETKADKERIKRIEYYYSINFCVWVMYRLIEDFMRYTVLVVREDKGFDDEKVHNYLDKIRQASERLDIDYSNFTEDTASFFEEMASPYRSTHFFKRMAKAVKHKSKKNGRGLKN